MKTDLHRVVEKVEVSAPRADASAQKFPRPKRNERVGRTRYYSRERQHFVIVDFNRRPVLHLPRLAGTARSQCEDGF